jgi:uncharacterized protein
MAEELRLIRDKAGADIWYLELKPLDDSGDAPVVLLLHGLQASKEDQLRRMYAFACLGYRSIAIDARLHGERVGAAELETRLLSNYHATMIEIIEGTVADVKAVLDHLDIAAAAIHGISLGAIITFAAFVIEPRLQVAITAMGSPDWVDLALSFGMPSNHPMLDELAKQSPLNLAARTYPPRPLLMLHGDLDARISISGVKKLHERLLPAYMENQERLRLVIYKDLDHVYTDEMLHESEAWLLRHFQLPPS